MEGIKRNRRARHVLADRAHDCCKLERNLEYFVPHGDKFDSVPGPQNNGYSFKWEDEIILTGSI